MPRTELQLCRDARLAKAFRVPFAVHAEDVELGHRDMGGRQPGEVGGQQWGCPCLRRVGRASEVGAGEGSDIGKPQGKVFPLRTVETVAEVERGHFEELEPDVRSPGMTLSVSVLSARMRSADPAYGQDG